LLLVVSELSIEIAGDKQLDDATRVKALHFLSSMARLKKKVLNFFCYFFWNVKIQLAIHFTVND